MADFRKASLLDDLDMPDISPNEIKAQLVKVGKRVSSVKKNSFATMPLEEKLAYVAKEVYKTLGRYKGFVKVINSDDEFLSYIDKAISIDWLSFDTETNNSLDPLTCKLMGLCLYMPNTRPVYVPINHCVAGTETLLPNQVSMEAVTEAFKRLKSSNTKMVYHNGKFDIRVCYNTTGVYLPIWWDTMIAAQLLNENELAKLKYQFKAHIDPTISQYDIEHLFAGLPYAWVDPEVFTLYAAVDAYDTYKLQQYQQKLFEQEGMERLYKLFLKIEVPVVSVTSSMEDFGITLDESFLEKLDTKYKARLEADSKSLADLLAPYQQQIEHFQQIGKLDNPINFDSPPQLSIVLYDILQCPVGESGRTTDKTTLKLLDTPFTKALLDYRHYAKLISSFTEPLKDWASPKDGKIHASFNQLGKEDNNVRTGRFSSTNPNVQQIPSHGDTMRMMFKAQKGYVIVGGDFSQQEPRILSHCCKDKNLIETYLKKKDLYATVGSFIFHKDYWECMEHYENGEANPEGKALRSRCKQLILGTLYGMGAKLMASNMKVTVEECREILEEFYKMFPAVKEFAKECEQKSIKIGYVEDYMGRRRHLPDASKPELEVHAKKKIQINASVFLDCTLEDDMVEIPDEELTAIWEAKWKEYESSHRFSAKKEFKALAERNGIGLFDNGAFIAKTRTQCLNAVIQGSASSLTKKAMVAIHNDPVMQELGFHILIPVHDELLGECPQENAEAVEKRLSELMIAAGKPECSVDMKVDTYVVKHWYQDEIYNAIRQSYQKAVSGGATREQAIKSLQEQYVELLPETVVAMCEDDYDVLQETV